MDALSWGERFVTGMPTVDAQHERLVQLINSFGELCSRHAEVPRARLEAVVDELARYAATHFRDEEALMAGSGVDPRFVRSHQAEHRRFLHDVGQMRASRFLEAPETARVLLRFLLHWLAFHILGTDMQLARQLERLQRGEAAGDAWTAEVRAAEGPAQLLLGALDDLMRVVAQRNHELVQANRTLEARVDERTRDLQAANTQLTHTVEALRATQVQLVEAEKLATVGQLASGLSHEINNPLGFISANVKVLGEHAEDLLRLVDATVALEPRMSADVREALHLAVEEADLPFVRDDLGHLLTETRDGVTRVQAIVRDLKDFSHVDGAQLLDTDLTACVQTTLKVLPARRREGVSFVTRFEGPPRVKCHAAMVNQAVLNLVLNATQAVADRRDPAGGVVTVCTGASGRGAFVEVTDTGVGMTPEVLAHAFEPFFTTRPPGQGTGLGLTTAWNCAQAHGGRLTATSSSGAGSTFRLWLPVEPPPGLLQTPVTLTNPFNARRTG